MDPATIFKIITNSTWIGKSLKNIYNIIVIHRHENLFLEYAYEDQIYYFDRFLKKNKNYIP